METRTTVIVPLHNNHERVREAGCLPVTQIRKQDEDYKGGETIGETVTEEHTPDGKLLKRTITKDDAAQSSAEIGWNAKGDVSTKIKVYEDDLNELDKKLEAFRKIAKKHQAL